MSNTPTPHINAKESEIAKTVIMPGDPLRAKHIAENYLEDAKCFNTVRNMLGFTGKYKGKEISVMGGGMGIPSIGIYTYELFNFYNVDRVIRIGSAGAINDKVGLRDIIIGMGACTNSAYACQYGLGGSFAPISDYGLLKAAEISAEKIGVKPFIGNILSSDSFYSDNNTELLSWRKMGVLAVEMEAAGLYMNAARAGKKALCILTISDCPLRKDIPELSAEDRQSSFSDMIKIALDIA